MRVLPTTYILTAVVCAVLAGCGGSAVENPLEKAKDALQKNDNASALILLKNAIQKTPSSGEARFLLGKALYDTGEGRLAQVELEKAADLGYPADKVTPEIARAMLYQGHLKNVIDTYSRTDLQDPSADAALKTTVAAAQALSERAPAARQLVAAALERKADYVPALLLSSRLKAAENDPAGAQDLLKRVLELEPNNAEALHLRGFLLRHSQSDFEGAMASQRAAIAAKPDYLQAYGEVVSMLLSKQDLEGAKREVAALKKVLPTHPSTRFYEVQMAYLGKDFVAARDMIQQILKVAPDSVSTLQVAGAIEMQLGSYVSAEKHLAQALSKMPEALPVRQLLAQTYNRTGQPDKALALLEPALALARNDPAVLSIAAEAYVLNGDIERAEILFKRVAELSPANVQSRTALALMKTGRIAEAEAGVDALRSVATTDSTGYADLALVTALLKRRDAKAALSAIESLEKKRSDFQLVQVLKAQAFMQMADEQSARAVLEKTLATNKGFFPAAQALANMDLALGARETAVSRYKSVLEADPKNAPARLAMAKLVADDKPGNEERLKLLTEAVRLAPADPTPRRHLVEHYLRQKEASKAVVTAQEGLVVLPDNPILLEALGVSQMAIGEFAQAGSAYQKIATALPGAAFPHIRIAEAYRASNNLDAAQQSLKRALLLDPAFVPARRAVLAFSSDTKRIAESLAMAVELQQKLPKSTVGFRLQGDLEGLRGDWAKAAAAYRAGMKVDPANAELTINLHQSLVKQRQPGEAAQLAAAWQRAQPKDTLVLRYLGDAAIAKADWPTAESVFQQIVRIQPANAIALNNVAWAMYMQKKRGALAFAEKAANLTPDSFAALDTLAVVLSSEGRRDAAIERMQKALAQRPQMHMLRLRMAKVLAEDNKKAEARKELETLAKLGPAFAGQDEVAQALKAL